MQELRGKYDGKVQSVLDAINEAISPLHKTSSQRTKKLSGRHAVTKQPTIQALGVRNDTNLEHKVNEQEDAP